MPPLAEQFQSYVQQLTGLALEWAEPARAALPSYLSQRYQPRPIALAGQPWLAVLLKDIEPPPPLQLRKHLDQLAAKLHPRPAGTCLVAEHLPPYLRTRLVALGQPFVIPGRQLFWPAIGSAETAQRPQRLQPKPVGQLGPVAQQLLIALLLRRLLAPVTISTAAQTLGCSAASVSQAVKALEGNALVHSRAQGRERDIELRDEPAPTWKRAQAMLVNPVRRRLRIRETEHPKWTTLRAGESALADSTSLVTPAEPIYAAASRDWTRQAGRFDEIPMPDEGTCVVELWRYPPAVTAEQGRVDPLSLYLSLRGSPDERVQIALEQLMEQRSW